MEKSFVITGVPGTGKSAIAGILAPRMGAALIDINKLVSALRLYSRVDSSDGSKVVRMRELEGELCESIKAERKLRPVMVEGHLACEMKLPAARVIVLRCEPSVLRSRLSRRKYSLEKLSQNALSEALDYCTILSEKNFGRAKVFEFDTTEKTAQQSAREIGKLLSAKKPKKKKISWPDALLREAISGEKIRGCTGTQAKQGF